MLHVQALKFTQSLGERSKGFFVCLVFCFTAKKPNSREINVACPRQLLRGVVQSPSLEVLQKRADVALWNAAQRARWGWVDGWTW